MKAAIVQGGLGAGDRCPSCGGTSGVAADDDGYSCLVCGGPRVLVDAPIVRPGAEKPLLERARQLRTRRATWGVAAGVSAGIGLVALLVSSVVTLTLHLGENGGEVAAALVLAPLLFSFFGFSRVRMASHAVRAALESAELVVVGEIARARGGTIEPAELAAILHVPVTRAEELSAEAQVERLLTQGEPSPPARVRVDSGESADVNESVEKRRDRVP